MQFDPASEKAMIQALRQPRERRPWQALITAVLALADGKAQLLSHTERSWASVTFSGSRHSFTLHFAGAEAIAAGEAMIAALPEHEFAIPRHIVADAAVISVEHRMLPEPDMVVVAELLLLEDC